MDRAAHQDWLRELAAEDRRRRAAAEPELERQEARVRAAQAGLAASEAAIEDIAAALEAARREADAAGSGDS